MIVYVEYVILDNLVIDYLLLLATFAVLKIQASKGRIFLASILGVVYALIFPILNFSTVVMIIFRVLSGASIVRVSCKYNGFKQFYISFIVFITFTFLGGGSVYAIYNFLGLTVGSEFSVAFIIVPTVLTINLAKSVILFLYQRKTIYQNTYNVLIILNGVTVRVNGFLDTGNLAYDNGEPLVFLSHKVCKRFFNGIKPLSLRRVSIRTINGEKKNLCFTCDKLIVFIGQRENIYNNVNVCITKNLNIGGAELLLHPDLIGGENGNSNYREDKKAC